jgi:hypothetical protein
MPIEVNLNLRNIFQFNSHLFSTIPKTKNNKINDEMNQKFQKKEETRKLKLIHSYQYQKDFQYQQQINKISKI